MSDQNLEYQLEVLVDDADKRMKALFASWDKIGKEAAKSYGKGLADSAREAKKEADQAARAYSDLDKAVTRAEKSADALVRRYAGLSPEIDNAISKLRQLVDTNKQLPEVTKIRDAREATPAGKMNLESQQIQQQIRDSVAIAQLRTREQAELERHQQWVEKKNAQMNKGLAQLAESRTNKEEAEQYKRIKINSQVMEYEEQQRLKEQEQVSKHQQWVESLNARMNKGVNQLNTKKSQQEQDEQYKRIRINTQVMEYEEQQRQKDQQSQEKHQQWVESLNSKMNKGLIQLAADKVKAQESAAAQQEAARQKELQSIQNAVAREQAAEKQREQAAIERYKTAQQAGEQRRLAQESDEKLNARSVTQQNSLWNAVEKADAALEKQAQTLRNLKNTGAADEIERLRTKLQEVASMDLAKIGGKGTLLPTQNVDKFLADNRLTIQGFDDEIKKLSEVSKTSAESHAERIRQAENLNATEAKIRATRYSDNAQFQSVVRTQEAETAAFLANLKTRSVGMTKSQVEAEISEHQRLASAQISLAAEGAQAEVNAQYARVTAMNKATMAVFAVQQAVEDYSYAGLRGAMNNISMLAMMVGGTGGLVAIFGAMALNVAHSSGALDKFSSSVGLSNSKTKEQLDNLKLLSEEFMHLAQLDMQSKQDLRTFNPLSTTTMELEKQVAAQNNNIAAEQEKLTKAKDAVAVYERMKILAEQIGENARIGPLDLGLANESVDTILEKMSAIRQNLQRSGSPVLMNEMAGYNKMLDQIEEYANWMEKLGYKPNVEGFKAAQDAAKATASDVRKLSSNLETLKGKLDAVAASADKKATLDKLLGKKFEASSQAASGGQAGKFLSEFMQEENKGWTEYALEMAQKANIEIQKAGDNKEHVKQITQELINLLQTELGYYEQDVKQAEVKASLLDKTIKGYEEAERSIKQQISDTEKLVEVSEKQLQNILEQKSAWEDSEAKRKAAALDKIDDLKLDEKKEAIDKKLKEGPGGLEWAKQRKEYLKDLAKYQLDTMKQENGNGKGDLNPDKQLQQQYDAYISNLDREYEAYVKNLEKKAEADKKAAEKATNSEKQKRLDQLKEDLGGKAQDSAAKAAQLQAEGKWDQAKSELEKSMKALKELHDAQQKAVGKATSEQSMKAEKEMEATSKKINGLYDNLAAIETARQEQAKQQLLEQQKLQQDIIDKKAQAASINMANPADVQTINALNTSLERTLALMQAIKAVQAVGASPVGGRPAGVAGGGAAGGVGNTSINITNNLAGGSALSANLAAAAAAQSLLIMRR